MGRPALGIFGFLNSAKRATQRSCGSKWTVYTSAANIVETFGQARVRVGGENEFVDFGIVEIERPRPLGWHEREFHTSAELAPGFLQHLLHAPQDQFPHGCALARGARFEASVNRDGWPGLCGILNLWVPRSSG